jgi:hypothetical protein
VLEICQEHSGMEEKIKANQNDIAGIKDTNNKQWERLDEYSKYANDWPKISDHGEDIAGMKRDLKIIMIIVSLILTAVVKLAFWPAA